MRIHTNKKIILASGSPRRQQFLKDLGIDYQLIVKPIEETYPKQLKTWEVAEYLAKRKAEPFLADLADDTLVITGDTIVCHADQVLGKPQDKAEAIQMLSMLSGTHHEVISSICITGKKQQKVAHDTTKVYFKPLTKPEIEFYVDTYKPYDKAGAYGIQEWIGQIGVTKIEGSYFSVMGMPTHLFYQLLQKF